MTLLGPLATVLLVLIIVTYVIMLVYVYAENYAANNAPVKGNALTDSSGVTPTAPVNLVAGNLTSSSATLTCQPVATALQYTVLYQIANSKTWVSYYTGTSSNITVNNLTPYAVYNFGVCAINNYGQSTTTVLTGVQLPGPNTSGAAPSAPTNLTPGNTTSTSVVLSWTPGAGSNAAAQYNILYQIVGSATSDWMDFATISVTTATVTGLKSNVPYNFGVTAINNYGTSVMTLLPNFELSNTPLGTPPLAPTGLTVSSSDDDSVTLTWMTAPTAVQYQVQYQVSGSTPHGGWIEFNNTPSASMTVTDLLAQIPYNFSVSSMNNYGLSSPSIISNVQLAPLSPAGSVSPPPTNFQCVPSVGSATLTWVAPSWTDTQNPIQYQILYQVDGGTSWITLPLTSNSTITISPLLSYVMYNFEIMAIDNYGASTAVYIDQVLIPGPDDTTVLPAAPSDFILLDSNSDSIDVQWSAVSGAAQYQIRYQVLGSTEWTEYAVTANTSLRISGLSPYVPYNFSVSGINNLGLGTATSLSNIQLSPTISTDKLPTYPSSIQAANLTPSSVTLNWSSVATAAQYQIQYQISSSSNWIESAVINATSLTISNLSPYIPYNFSVTAINNTGSSVPGYLNNVTLPGPPTAQTAPARPTGIQSTNVTTNSVDLSWNVSTGTAQYEVQYQVSGSSTWTFYQLTTSTVMTLTGLSSFVSYNFSVTAINNYGSSPVGTLNNVVMLGPQNTGTSPSSVSNLQVGTITSTSVPLTWSGVTGITQYRVQYQVQGSSSSADGWVEFAVVSSPLTTVTGLLNYVTYNFSVVAINNYGASNPTIVTGVQIPGPGSSGSAPMPPVNLTSGALTTTTVPLSWSANTTGSGTPIQYEVSYQVVGSATNAWALFGVTTTPSLVVTGLVPSTQYNFSVIAINNYGASQGSLITNVQTQSSTPAGTAPLTPTNLICTAATLNTLTLTWTPVNTATQYTVAYQVSGSASNSWVQLGNTSNSNVTVNSLASGSNYNLTVTAINNYGSSVPASLNLVQTLATGANGSVPVMPTGLAVVSATPTSVNLIWNTSSDAVQYAINYQTAGSGTSWVEFGTTSNESTTVTGLIPYVRYNFSLIAINNYGVSSPLILNNVPMPSVGGSGSIPATPIGFNIAGTALDSGSMLFQWNKVTGATQYLFAYKLTNGTQWYDIVVSTNSIVLDTLVPNLNYSFSVSSINTSGTSPANLLNNLTTLPAVTGLSKTSNILSWNAVPGANNYIVAYSGPKTYTGVTDPTLNWVLVPNSGTSISTTSLSGAPYSFYVFGQNTVTATAGFASILMNAV